jgi:CRISPR-associated protein Csx14
MEVTMPDAVKTAGEIPVDLFNPGQVFACLGIVESADILAGGAEGFFDWSDPANTKFRVRAHGPESPVVRVLAFFDSAEAHAEAIEGSPNLNGWKASWGAAPTLRAADVGYPFPDPPSPATLVCALVSGSDRIVIDHWGDVAGRDNVKFWAGSGGYPGAGLVRDALELVRGRAKAAASDPFALSAPQSSSFRFDWRRDYVPIDAGFSLNAHGNMYTRGFPLVELLAVIGLTHARPRRPNRRDKLLYEYAVVGRSAEDLDTWLSPSVLRAALGMTKGSTRGAPLPWARREFCMRLDWPGQKDQARSITTVTEVPSK